MTGPQRRDNSDGRLDALRVRGHYLPMSAAVVLVVGFVERVAVGTPPGPPLAWRHAAPVCALSLALIGGHWLDQRAGLRPVRRADPVLVALSLATSLCLFLIVIATLRLSAAWDPDALTGCGAALGRRRGGVRDPLVLRDGGRPAGGPAGVAPDRLARRGAASRLGGPVCPQRRRRIPSPVAASGPDRGGWRRGPRRRLSWSAVTRGTRRAAILAQ
jgi:hypothetical protein